MIQLELYLNEISNFLKTLTIKNTFIAKHMCELWVSDEYRAYAIDHPEIQPYYRNITGDYILADYTSLEQAYGIYKSRLTAAEYQARSKYITDLAENKFHLTRTTNINGSEIPNCVVYRYANVLPAVNSYDTQEIIPFTKDVLSTREHINTAEIYKIPNANYNKLISKYITSSAIIKAISYPIMPITDIGQVATSMQLAISADNFTLLAYDTSMLESSEQQSMLTAVTTTLDMIRKRYAIDEYRFEQLYPQAHDYIIWNILYLTLFVQRIKNIKSSNVHSFHLWSYLKSHGLGEYRDILSVRQQQFLYRNIEYLIEHKGTEHALDILIYTLLTVQNISLRGINTIQDISAIDTTAQKLPMYRSITVAEPILNNIFEMQKQNKNLRYQDILAYLGTVAGTHTITDHQEYAAGVSEDPDTIYEKERKSGLEYDVDYLYEASKQNCNNLIKSSSISHRNTKLLELSNNKYTNTYAQIYTRFCAETLIYRLSLNDLNFSVSFTPPQGIQQITLPAKVIVAFIIYSMLKLERNKIVDMYEKSQATSQFDTSDRTRPFIYGHRIYEDWYLLDKPPSKFKLEWPYRTIYNDEATDFPPVPDTTMWYMQKYDTRSQLSAIITSYQCGLLDKAFMLENPSDDKALYCWISEDSNWIIEYYSLPRMWTIADRYNNVHYHTDKLSVFTADIHKLVWYDYSDNVVDLALSINKKKYLIDDAMVNYYGAFSNASDFSNKVHKQAINFINLFIEDNQDASCIRHSAYNTILADRLVSNMVTVDLLSGKTYTEYLNTVDTNISMFKSILQKYDNADDPALLYGELAECLVKAIYPVDTALLIENRVTSTEIYQKLIKLFRSLIAYNLAFIAYQYRDVYSTTFRPLTNEIMKSSISEYTTEITDYREDCRTIFWDRFTPAYCGQTNVVLWKDTLSLSNKIAILNNISNIKSILNTSKSEGSKRAALKKLFIAKQIADYNTIINYLLSKPLDSVTNLEFMNKKIGNENIDTHSYENDCTTQLFKERVIVIGQNSSKAQLKDISKLFKSKGK